MAETVNLNTVFSGFDSGTDLQPKNTRQNNQGVTVEDIAGFVKFVTVRPDATAGTKGDMAFYEDAGAGALYICITSETFTGGTGNNDAVWVSAAFAV